MKNKADGLNAKICEYTKENFIKGLREYLDTDGNDLKVFMKNDKGILYASMITSFDIETTSTYANDVKVAIPYIWQFAIQDYVFYGRHFEDIVEMFNILSKVLELNSEKRIIVWVHNLSFEFQFIKKYFKWIKVFSLDIRKPIYAVTDNGIEFRCSLMLSGMKLADVANKGIHKGKVTKMVGDLDYSKVRHESTPLSKEEMQYCINDVLVVVEYITEQVNEIYGRIVDIPLTKTGAVRKLVRKETVENEIYNVKCKYRNIISKLTISYEEYKLLKRAFQGGFTHANPNKVNMILENISSADIASSYPAVLCTEKYPMSKGRKVKIETYEDYMTLSERGLLVFDCKIMGLRSIVDYEHTLAYSKCWRVRKTVVDNNRIVSSDELFTSMTNIDFEMLLNFYEIESIQFGDCYYYEKDYLPRELVRAILELYKDKTQLKGTGEDLIYMLKKSNLNSVYGMMVMDVVRENYEYDNDMIIPIESNPEIMIEVYNNNRNRFLYYPWGIFCTAYARRRLQQLILLTKDDHVYSDTDSDKFENIENHRSDIEYLNSEMDKKIEKVCKERGFSRELFYPKDKHGIEYPLGYWDIETDEGGIYTRFKTLGAKRYLVEQGGKIKLTCAGVDKKKGAEYLISTGNPFGFFREGLVIDAENTGKLTAYYSDEDMEVEITDYLGNTELCKVKSFTHLEPTEFSLNMDTSFKRFLSNLENHKIIRRL